MLLIIFSAVQHPGFFETLGNRIQEGGPFAMTLIVICFLIRWNHSDSRFRGEIHSGIPRRDGSAKVPDVEAAAASVPFVGL